jgi:hypothetical protein
MSALPEDVTRALEAISALAPKLAAKQWRGTWGASTKYASGDLVNFNSRSFFSLTNGNQGHRPGSEPTYWQPVQPVVSKTYTGMSSVTTGDGLLGDGTAGSPLRVNGSALGTHVPEANRVPQALEAGYIDSGWDAPSINENVRYCSPWGNDSHRGDSDKRPKLYFETAWNELQALGGGTIYVQDETRINAGNNGLHIGATYVNAPGWVRSMPVRVVGVGPHSSRGFGFTPTCQLLGGAQDPSTNQDDPGIWIAGALGHPMSFENIRLRSGLNKPIRIGWDHYERDTSGNIVKPAILNATRANGLTTLTLTPYSRPLTHIKRVSNVVTVTVAGMDFQRQQFRAGQRVYIDYTHASFTAGEFTVVDVASDVNTLNAFTVASVGANFDAGVYLGPTIGTVESHHMLPRDYMTVYSTNAQFPSSQYKARSVTFDTVTVDDFYGYGSRSASADEDDIGTYSVHDRLLPNAAMLSLNNVAATPQISDVATERFVSGPCMDVGSLIYFDFKDLHLDGFNIKAIAGEFGCRDPERRAWLMADCGSAAASMSYGVIHSNVGAYGGARWHGTGNGGLGNGYIYLKQFSTDNPLGNWLPLPAVDLLDISRTDSVYVEGASVADANGETPTVQIDAGAPWDSVTVMGTYGLVSGPCNLIGPPTPFLAAGSSSLPNQQRQTGWWGFDRLISGRAMGAIRNQALFTSPLPSYAIAQAPAGWLVSGGVTITAGFRDPFGGTRAYRCTGTGNILFQWMHVIGSPNTSENGDIYQAAMWMRGEKPGVAASLLVNNNAANQTYLTKNMFMPQAEGASGEWNCLTAGGVLSGLSAPSTDTVTRFGLTLTGSETVYIFLPQLYVLRVGDAGYDEVSAAEQTELLTNIQPIPSYILDANMVGTLPGQKLCGHGGLASGLAYVEGVGAGQLTVVGSFTPKKYEPVYNPDGTIKGWMELIQATVNP